MSNLRKLFADESMMYDPEYVKMEDGRYINLKLAKRNIRLNKSFLVACSLGTTYCLANLVALHFLPGIDSYSAALYSLGTGLLGKKAFDFGKNVIEKQKIKLDEGITVKEKLRTR